MSALYQDRLRALRAAMRETGTDLVALGPSSHMFWLTGVDPHGDERPVMVLISLSEIAFLMPALNAEAARQHTQIPFYEWSDGDGPNTALNAALTRLLQHRDQLSVVLDETMRTDFSMLLTDLLSAPSLRFCDDTVSPLRAVKDASERSLLKRAAHITDAAVMAGFDALALGCTELDIMSVVIEEMKRLGVKPGFCTVAFGANAAMPHHASGTTALAPDTPILIDAGCRLDGYASDMTRMAFFGEPAPNFLAVFDVVEAAIQAAMDSLQIGMTGAMADHAARKVIENAGYGAAFLHRLGHGIGIDVHEPPFLTPSSSDILKEGATFSIEPGIYLSGQFGIRLEDIALLTRDGPEVLSDLDRSLVRRG